MVKKVVIAAAGRGTRMLDLSKDKPKPLIEVNGRPFLAYLLDSLSLAGYNEIILVGGYMVEQIKIFAEKYISLQKKELKIKVINQFDYFKPEEKYGTACPLMCIEKEIKDEQFLYICGDNLFSVRDLNLMNVEDNFNYVAGVKQDHPEKYGVLVGDDLLEKIVEKPINFIGNLVNAGLYKFTNDIFDKIYKINKSPRGEYEITDAISLLAEDKKVKIKKVEDYWQDFGNPEDIKKLADFLSNGNNKKE